MSSASNQRRVTRKVSDEYKQACGTFTPQLFRRTRCALCFFDASQHNSGAGEGAGRERPEGLKKNEAASSHVPVAAIGRPGALQSLAPAPQGGKALGGPPVVPPRGPDTKSPRTTLRVTIADDEVSRAASNSISDRNIDVLAAGLKRANTSGNLPRVAKVEDGQVPLCDSAPAVARKRGEEPRGAEVGRSGSNKKSKAEKKVKKEKKAVPRAARSNSQPSKEGVEELLKVDTSAVQERSPCSPRTSKLKKARNRLSTDYLPALLLRGDDHSAPPVDEGALSDSEVGSEKEQKKKKDRSLFNRIRGKADSSKSSKIKSALPSLQNSAGASSKRSSQSPVVGYLRVSVLRTSITGKLRELERDGVGVNLKLGKEGLPSSLVMFSPFQQGLQPSQWLFPVTEQDLKTEELLVTVMNFVSRQTIGLISVPLKGVPFMHNSMTFGVMRSYAWTPVHKLNGSVRIGLKLTKTSSVTKAEGCWTLNCSGGDLDHNTWIRSPQYFMTVGTESLVAFTLRSQVGVEHSMGFYVLRLKDCERANDIGKKLVDEDIESHIDSYHVWMQKSDVVDGETYLTPGKYVLIVCTSEPSVLGDFTLFVSSPVCVDLALSRIEDGAGLGGVIHQDKSDGGDSDFGDFFDDSAAGPRPLKLSVDRSSNGGEQVEDDWDLGLDLPVEAPGSKLGFDAEDEEDWDANWGDDDDDDDDVPAPAAVAKARDPAMSSSAPHSPADTDTRHGEDTVLTGKLLSTIEAGDSKKFQSLLSMAKREPLSLSAALLSAVKRGNTGMVKACIAHNANIDSRDHNGATPLLYAAELGSYEIGKLLCDSGCDCSAVDQNGEGALLKASKRGHLGFLRLPWEVENFEMELDTPSVQVDTPWEVCAIYHSQLDEASDDTNAAGAIVRPQQTLYIVEVFLDLPDAKQQAVLQLAIHNNEVVQSVVCFDCGSSGRDACVNSHMLVTALVAVSYRLAQVYKLPKGLSLQDARCVCIFMLTSKEFSSLFESKDSTSSISQFNLAGSLGEISSIRGFFDYVDTLWLLSADFRSGKDAVRKSCTQIRGSFPQYRTAALVLSDAGYARLSVLLRGAKVPRENKGEFYFIIRVGESQHKTKLRRLKEMDSMNAKFTFAVDSPQDEIQVVLFTKTKAVNNLALGGLTMLVKDLPEENISKRDWHELTAPGKKVVGQALLEFNYSRVQRDARM